MEKRWKQGAGGTLQRWQEMIIGHIKLIMYVHIINHMQFLKFIINALIHI